MSLSFMMMRSSPSIFTSVPDHLPNRMRSPALTSSGVTLPSSARAPVPTEITSPSCGFSLAVSGMIIPPEDFSSASTRRTRTRSCNGLKPMDRNPFLSVELKYSRWHSRVESASDAGHMVVGHSSVNGPGNGFCLCVRGPGQAEPVAHDPAGEHQHGDRGKAARQPDPDADALPILAERQPRADAEADAPIADQREDQRPAGVVEPAQH